jgi:hypothetical protein
LAAVCAEFTQGPDEAPPDAAMLLVIRGTMIRATARRMEKYKSIVKTQPEQEGDQIKLKNL